MVGFRTPAGVVTTTQTFKTIHLPRLVRGKPDAWDPLICLDWGHRFITFLRKVVQAGNDVSSSSVWRVRFAPSSGVSVRLLSGQSDIDEVVNGEERVGFLPRWYWEELVALKATAATLTDWQL